MKRWFLFITSLGLLTGRAFAEPTVPTANVQISTRPLQAAFVWALGKDVNGAGDVELDIQEELIKHGVAGERSVKLFPKGMVGPADRILTQIRTTGCDSVLVVRRTSTIHWESEDGETSSLRSLVAHRTQLLDPKDTLATNAATPIVVSNITGTGDWQIVQGEAIVFDLKSGKILWRGNTQIKTAKDLPQARYFKVLAEKVAHELEVSGLIGPVKK